MLTKCHPILAVFVTYFKVIKQNVFYLSQNDSMKRSDHILALTNALLQASPENYQRVLGLVKEMYELSELRKPASVSLGAVSITKHEQSFESWLIKLREEKILTVRFFYAAVDQNNLAPHIAAAFAGTTDLLMQVKTGKGLCTLGLTTYFSPSYEITPQQFVLLLEAQADQQLVWSRASEMILESNRLNDRTIFDSSETRAYLLNAEGGSVFEFLAGDLLKELQIECLIHNKTFVIPDELKALFIKYPPLPGYEGEDREYVYLYPVRDVTSEEILTLAEAQPFASQIWEELNKTLEEYQDESMKPMPVAQWKGKIMSMDSEMLQRIVHPVCRSICKLCENQNVKPVIPSSLADVFGPNELDQKRAAARSKSEKDNWSLEPIKQPWEYYAFQEIAYGIEVQSLGIEQAQSAFSKALEEIKVFAAEIQSPYEEAFSLALFIITGVKDFSSEELIAQVKSSGFSERAIEVLNGRVWIADQFRELGLKSEKVRGLLAISIADVFGGMGSWNDQYGESDQERYQTVSANMFQALKNYFAAIISSPHS
jgi:hypothetical protein